MKKPVVNFKIVSPGMESPIPGESAPCGSSWYSQIEIRAPYRGTDRYVSILPILQEAGPFPTKSSDDLKSTVPDLDKAILELVKVPLHTNILSGILAAKELLDGYHESGYIDEKNRASIQSMIDLAKKYYSAAKSLINFLIKASPKIDPKKWPEEDRLKIFNLLKSSIENARCAQEAACVVGNHNRNKEAYEAAHGKGIQRAVPKMRVSEIPIPGLGSSIPEEQPSTSGDTPAEGPRKKKKDNTVLIAGAAALGLLMLKGK